jgi:hypothetical protein
MAPEAILISFMHRDGLILLLELKLYIIYVIPLTWLGVKHIWY